MKNPSFTCHGSRFTAVLHFPEHEVFEEGVVRGEACDGKTGKAVAEAALEEKAAREGRRAGRGDAQRRGAPAGLEHLTCGQRSVALADHAVVMRGIAHAVVEEVAAERPDARAGGHLHRLVDVRALPAAAPAVVETQLVIRIPAAALDPASHVEGAACDAV